MIIYVWKNDYRSYGFSSDVWGGDVLKVEVPDNFSGGNKTYSPDTGEWITDLPYIPTHEDYVREAEMEQKRLIADANNYINNKQWPSKLAMQRLSNSEKIKFNLWLDYTDALDALNLDTAPDIEWPLVPSVY